MIRPGLCSVTLRDRPWADVVALAASSGLEGIEWGGDVHVRPGDDGLAARVRRAADAAGLVCPSYGSYLRAGDAGADGPEVGAVLDTAEALGATNVRVWCRWLGAADAGPADRAAIGRDLEAWCAAAGDRDLTVSLEHHQWTLTETVRSTEQLLAAVGAPNLFTYWQPCDALSDADLLTEVAALGPHLSHLHVFHWDAYDARHALADGAERWRPVLGAVADPPGARWSGHRWALLEFVRGDDPDQLVTDAGVLRSWLAEPAGWGPDERRPVR